MSLLAAFAAAALAGTPRVAPATYTTENYALTFQVPKGATYCPLPKGWVGSDHGTVLFLVPPDACGGAGHASGGRGFSPNVPRIEVYYGHWDEEDMRPPACPQPIGNIAFKFRDWPLCKSQADGMPTVSFRVVYAGDGPDEAIFTLVTTPERLDVDVETLRTLANSVRSCKVTIRALHGPLIFGSGEPCPSGGWF